MARTNQNSQPSNNNTNTNLITQDLNPVNHVNSTIYEDQIPVVAQIPAANQQNIASIPLTSSITPNQEMNQFLGSNPVQEVNRQTYGFNHQAYGINTSQSSNHQFHGINSVYVHKLALYALIIEEYFSQRSIANSSQIRRNLHEISRGNRIVSEYLQEAKPYANALSAIVEMINNIDLVNVVLRGLALIAPPTPQQAYISGNPSSYTPQQGYFSGNPSGYAPLGVCMGRVWFNRGRETREVLLANFKKLLVVHLKNNVVKGTLVKVKTSLKLSDAAKKYKVASKLDVKAVEPAKKWAVSKVMAYVLAVTEKKVKKVGTPAKTSKKYVAVKPKQPKFIKSPTAKKVTKA
ncbi:hypothetical protein IFM89_007086 [Coptis chinensis]|uniref:Uncharacterized protein n=1 Tax=Coptis chinensis TaxID=261450 RepID=A0A835H365_9MAGN|nr:hypothetical protein IFM89_007086 [Coptis chinensis]